MLTKRYNLSAKMVSSDKNPLPKAQNDKSYSEWVGDIPPDTLLKNYVYHPNKRTPTVITVTFAEIMANLPPRHRLNPSRVLNILASIAQLKVPTTPAEHIEIPASKTDQESARSVRRHPGVLQPSKPPSSPAHHPNPSSLSAVPTSSAHLAVVPKPTKHVKVPAPEMDQEMPSMNANNPKRTSHITKRAPATGKNDARLRLYPWSIPFENEVIFESVCPLALRGRVCTASRCKLSKPKVNYPLKLP